MVFAGYSGFLHYLQLASHELATIGINVTKNKIQIQILPQLIAISRAKKPVVTGIGIYVCMFDNISEFIYNLFVSSLMFE